MQNEVKGHCHYTQEEKHNTENNPSVAKPTKATGKIARTTTNSIRCSKIILYRTFDQVGSK